MRDILPAELISKLAGQYRLAVALAVDNYTEQAGDEDSVTGAFGLAVKSSVSGVDEVAGETWIWKTTSTKLRGRGSNAPEKRLGADAAIELAVWSGTRVVARKTLLMQAKNNWTGTDAKLGAQAQMLAALPGGALVVDYRATGFSAVEAHIAAKARGRRSDVPSRDFRTLGEFLATDFLDCSIGSRSTHYDAEGERLVVVDLRGTVSSQIISLRNHIQTQVTLK